MSRAEEVRTFWEERVPPNASFYLGDVARYTAGIISLRTLQRRAADGALPVIGGSDRAVKNFRVLRSDLIRFLCTLDSISGSPPPAPTERTPAPPRPRRGRKRKGARQRQTPAPRPKDQGSLFED